MESFVKILILVICCAHVANMVTISEVQAKIEQEMQYLDGVVAASQSAIYQSISASRSVLNIRGETLKTEINQGKLNCKLYAEQIRSIQEYQVNFVYEYQPCEYIPRLNKMSDYKIDLAEKKKLARLIATLSVPTGNATISSACTNQINMANNNVNTVHSNIVNAIAGINLDVSRCIPNKQREINTMFETVYEAWKKCQIL